MTLGLQHTGQSSTYRWSAPPDGSTGITIRYQQDGQTYAPSSLDRRRFFFRFFIQVSIHHAVRGHNTLPFDRFSQPPPHLRLVRGVLGPEHREETPLLGND